MAKGKNVREKGKVSFSEYFKTLDDGARVTFVPEKSIRFPYPERIRGRTGVVAGTRGRSKIVKVNDKNKLKTLVVHPVHLRRV